MIHQGVSAVVNMVNAAEHADLLKAAVGLSAGDEFPIQAKYNPKHFEVEDDRDERLRSCSMVDTEAEPRFDAITKYVLLDDPLLCCRSGEFYRLLRHRKMTVGMLPSTHFASPAPCCRPLHWQAHDRRVPDARVSHHPYHRRPRLVQGSGTEPLRPELSSPEQFVK